MTLDRAAAIKTVNNRQTRKSDTPSSAPGPIRIAERTVGDRLRRVVDLAFSLLSEAETLACDEDFTEQSNKLESLDFSEGVDFYSEVQRFETRLIKLALDHTRGNQAKAARILHIKPTTLNSKIKLYGIEYKSGSSGFQLTASEELSVRDSRPSETVSDCSSNRLESTSV